MAKKTGKRRGPSNFTISVFLLLALWVVLVAWLDALYKERSAVKEKFCEAWPKEGVCRWWKKRKESAARANEW